MARTSPEPRMLTQQQAANYCGLCASNFKKACPVPPITLLDRIPRYDRLALDRWLDTLSNFRPIEDSEDWVLSDAGNCRARTGH